MNKWFRLFILLGGIFIIITSSYRDIKEIKNKEYRKENTFHKINLVLSVIVLPIFTYQIYKVYIS